MSVDSSRSLSNSVALPYRIRQGSDVFFLPFTASVSYRYGIQWALFPWRGLLVGILLSGVILLVAQTANLPLAWLLVAGGVAIGTILSLCLTEAAFRRDRLVQEGVERRFGIFGQRSTLIPYQTIRWVTVEEPGGLWPVNVGDLIVRTDDSTHRFVAVAEPKAIAAVLENLRKQSPTVRD